MMQVIPKWKVRVCKSAGGAYVDHIVFTISDHFIGNVIRDVARLDFGEKVISVTIDRAEITTEAQTFMTTTQAPVRIRKGQPSKVCE